MDKGIGVKEKFLRFADFTYRVAILCPGGDYNPPFKIESLKDFGSNDRVEIYCVFPICAKSNSNLPIIQKSYKHSHTG